MSKASWNTPINLVSWWTDANALLSAPGARPNMTPVNVATHSVEGYQYPLDGVEFALLGQHFQDGDVVPSFKCLENFLYMKSIENANL